MVQSQPSEFPTFPPGDLWSDEPPLESYRHVKQLILLLTCLERLWSDKPFGESSAYHSDFFAGVNMSVYYSTRQRTSSDLRGPDFFVVLNTERKERKSWVVWEEDGKYPNFVLEVLSDSTAKIDRGLKKQLYQDVWRTPDYFWFDPYRLEFKGFQLMHGEYEEIEPNDRGWLWSDQLQLYLGIIDEQLRFFTPDGTLVLTPDEGEAQAQAQAQAAQAQAQAERDRAEAAIASSQLLRQKLQEMGINPDELEQDFFDEFHLYSYCFHTTKITPVTMKLNPTKRLTGIVSLNIQEPSTTAKT